MDHNLTRATGTVAAAVWFVLLFVVAMMIATVTLSASQLQSRMASLSEDNRQLSVWQIERIRKTLNSERDRVDKQTDKVHDLYNAMIEAEARVNEAENRLAEAKIEYARRTNELAAKLRLFFPREVPEQPASVSDQDLKALFEDIIAKLEGKLQR